MIQYHSLFGDPELIEDLTIGKAFTADAVFLPEDGEEWISTGLLDVNGTKLYRRREARRIGFHV